MIKQKLLKKYHKEVNDAIVEAFEVCLANQKNPGDFLLFLENGHKTSMVMDGFSDYLIGQGLKGIADWDRLGFLEFYYRQLPFEKTYNRLRKKDKKEYIYKNSLHFDLMIYTHSWEAYPNLSRLKQMANMVNKDSYDWDIQIPDFTRHTFIRQEIRDVFKAKKLKLADIMSRSYHSQLRNAFAHSDYSFFKTGFIELRNYKGEPWELREISYAQWDERFTLTILLFSLLFRNISEYKKKLGYINPPFSWAVWVPEKRGTALKLKHLWYDKHYNRFLWEYQKPNNNNE